MADVVGHGTPAAVLMAITHSLAHNHRPVATDPAAFLSAINRDLASRYTRETGAFVTAFYAVYDQKSHEVVYSNAGHPPPLVKRCATGDAFGLEGGHSLPLGIDETAGFDDARASLAAGDQVVLYTDGITEAFSPDRQMYGVERLRKAIENCALTAAGPIATILDDVSDSHSAARRRQDPAGREDPPAFPSPPVLAPAPGEPVLAGLPDRSRGGRTPRSDPRGGSGFPGWGGPPRPSVGL